VYLTSPHLTSPALTLRCRTLYAGGEAGEVLCHHTCRRSELDVHQRDCEFRPVPCEHCERDVAQRRGPMHAKTCDRCFVECPNECGAVVRRGEMKHHCYAECGEQTVPCTLRHMGCVARHLRTAAPEHMVDNAGGHVALVATAVEHLQAAAVWPARYCPPRHPTHFKPSFIELNDIT